MRTSIADAFFWGRLKPGVLTAVRHTAVKPGVLTAVRHTAVKLLGMDPKNLTDRGT